MGPVSGVGKGAAAGLAWVAMTGLDSKPPIASRSALDRPAARLIALGVFLMAAGALGWFHRDDIFPPDAAALADNPIASCIS